MGAANLPLVRSILGREPAAPDRSPMPLKGPIPNSPAGGGEPEGDEKLTGIQAGYRDEALQCSNCDAFLEDGAPCMKISDPVSAGGFCMVHSELVKPGGGAGEAAKAPPIAPGGAGAPAPAAGAEPEEGGL